MKLNLDVKFNGKKEKMTCVIRFDGHTFICTKQVQAEADRVDAYKRAKQKAYLGAMTKVHGYICSKRI